MEYVLPLRAKVAARRRRANPLPHIGITGSSAKTTTAALLAHILEGVGKVQAQVANNAYVDVIKTITKNQKDCGFKVVEVGAGKSGDIHRAAKILRPDVAIVTLVALEHYSSFRSLEAVCEEKQNLVAALRPDGFAVLNHDDPHVMSMAKCTTARIVTFGRGEGADCQVTDIASAFPNRLAFKIVWGGNEIGLKTQFAAEHFWLPAAAAFTAAAELGVDPRIIAERIATFEPIINRCSVIAAPNGPTFLIDTAKAPYHSIGLAFEMIAKAKAPRKRIVLGQMSDMTDSRAKYRRAYRQAREACDEVIFVGEHAHRSKASQEDRDSGRFYEFATARQVADHIRATAVAGELILLKSSPNMHLERVALQWTRQVKCWEDKCGKIDPCEICGLFDIPFEQHKQAARRRKKRTLRTLENRSSERSA